MPPRAVILSAVRTPVGRRDGALAGVRPDDLAGIAIGAAVERAGVPAAEIEEMLSAELGGDWRGRSDTGIDFGGNAHRDLRLMIAAASRLFTSPRRGEVDNPRTCSRIVG